MFKVKIRGRFSYQVVSSDVDVRTSGAVETLKQVIKTYKLGGLMYGLDLNNRRLGEQTKLILIGCKITLFL